MDNTFIKLNNLFFVTVLGKMAQSQNQSSVEFVDTEERVTQLFSDKSLEINSCFSVTDNCLQISYKKKDEYARSNRKTQLFVNSTITALSRIYLDQSLRKLKANGATLIYSDTDSTVYSIKKGSKVDLPFHPTQFGSFSSETAEGEEISLFVCIGAKNYSYEVRDALTKKLIRRVTKIRGLSLNSKLEEQMDTNKMLEFVQIIQQTKKIQEAIPQMRIQINKESKRLTAREIQSTYTNFSNDKRFYNRDFHQTKLWPYGTTSYNYE